jgi:TonB family protein
MRITVLIALALVLMSCAQKVLTEEPKVDAKWVEGVAREHNHEVLKCYEDSLKVDKKTQGDLALELDTSALGAVTAVRVVKSVSTTLDECVSAKAKTWTYPWIKSETLAIQERFRLYLNAEGNPMAGFSGPAMDHEVVRESVRAHLSEVQQCYSARLKRVPQLKGKLVLQWDILGSGEVTNVKVKESVDPVVDKCVADKLAKWKFPAPPNNMVANVSYPFQFTPATTK